VRTQVSNQYKIGCLECDNLIFIQILWNMPSPAKFHNNGADLLLYTYPNSFYCQKVFMQN